MGYKEAIEAAGAEVLVYEAFGDYQGAWWALVNHDGNIGWLHGSYGSCSGCDAFESEFGYNDEEEDPVGYKAKLQAFGQSYLDGIMSHADAVAKASENLSWDMEAEAVVKFFEAHRPTGHTLAESHRKIFLRVKDRF